MNQINYEVTKRRSAANISISPSKERKVVQVEMSPEEFKQLMAMSKLRHKATISSNLNTPGHASNVSRRKSAL